MYYNWRLILALSPFPFFSKRDQAKILISRERRWNEGTRAWGQGSAGKTITRNPSPSRKQGGRCILPARSSLEWANKRSLKVAKKLLESLLRSTPYPPGGPVTPPLIGETERTCAMRWQAVTGPNCATPWTCCRPDSTKRAGWPKRFRWPHRNATLHFAWFNFLHPTYCTVLWLYTPTFSQGCLVWSGLDTWNTRWLKPAISPKRSLFAPVMP